MHYLGPEAEVLCQRYAQALIETAEESGELDKAAEDFAFIDTLMREDKQLTKIFYHPEIEKDDKLKLLDEISKKTQFCEVFSSFIKLLAKKNRLELIHGIFSKYRNLHDARKGGQKVFVKTAVSLSEEQLGQLKGILEKRLNKDIIIEEIIEPSLIGGLNLRIGNVAHRLSLINRLEFVEERLRLT